MNSGNNRLCSECVQNQALEAKRSNATVVPSSVFHFHEIILSTGRIIGLRGSSPQLGSSAWFRRGWLGVWGKVGWGIIGLFGLISIRDLISIRVGQLFDQVSYLLPFPTHLSHRSGGYVGSE